MSATPSFEDLTTVPDQDTELDQNVLPELVKRGVRVTDWLVGSVLKAFAYVVAKLSVNARLAIATLVCAEFEDYVFGRATPPPNPDGSVIDVTGWAPLVAAQRYGIIQIPASYTRRTITLTNTSTNVYGPLVPGPALILEFPSGNRYLLDQSVTIPASGSVQATFRAEFPNDSTATPPLVYNDPPDSSPLILVTSNYPGVTASNPAPTFSPVSQSGSGLGGLILTGTPSDWPTPHAVAIKIVATGRSGAGAEWQYSVDNAAWSATQTAASASIGLGITVTLTDNGGNPSFLEDAIYYFSVHGSDVTQVGADVESAQELGVRCRGVVEMVGWPRAADGTVLPLSPTDEAYVALARVNSNVRVAFAITDGTINNLVRMIIAGQGGNASPPSDIANVQEFFDHFDMITDDVLVASTTPRAITLSGLSITCKLAQLASAQAELIRRLSAYLGSVDPAAPLGINGLVDYDYLIALVRTVPGVTKVSGTLTINGAAADLQLPVTAGAYESATWSQVITDAFSWSTT